MVCLSLNLIFGGSSCPGNFDTIADVVCQALLGQPRLNPEATGETHPKVCRFVDDFFSIMATFGVRGPDHIKELRRLITALFGEAGLNPDKMEGPGTMKAAFGVILDTVKRVFICPWSKLVKFFDLTADYAEGKTSEITYGTLAQIHGLAQHILRTAPGFRRLLLPRLVAGLTDAARANPGNLAFIPPTYVPEFNLAGESAAEGTLMLQRALNLVLRMASLHKGALFSLSPEAMLPIDERMTWPRRPRISCTHDYGCISPRPVPP